MRAIEVPEYGETDVLTVVEDEIPEPGEGEVRIAVEAAGINFADIMQRRGHYPGGPEPPFRPGFEAAGTVDAVGEGVDYDVGDRVVGLVGEGGYAEYAVTGADSLFPVPEGMSFAEAAGFPVQFLTAHNCLFEWGGLESGESVLIQAAAGGVGTAAVQLANRASAEVFGTASTQEKRDLAAELGCDHPIDYTSEDFVEVVHEHTDGEGVDLALDGVGGDVFADSFRATKEFGRVVPYGAASGEPGTIEATDVFFRNQSVVGYHLGNAMQTRPQQVLQAVPDLTEGLESGELEVIVGERFALEDAADAHEFIEDRKSSGKVVLEP
ncbi:quinone oxidoreductase family protein [Haloarchaeobius sp. TZWWS8]|uniref:quinone oxidoreductase family protein n=1 Tax=Haloarchaeobius sp. TZWWS8 TaxID=3446121 RepID=UPI003EBF16D3